MEVSEVQPWKEFGPISNIVLGNSTKWRFLQSLNAFPLMVVTPSLSTTFVTLFPNPATNQQEMLTEVIASQPVNGVR